MSLVLILVNVHVWHNVKFLNKQVIKDAAQL